MLEKFIKFLTTDNGYKILGFILTVLVAYITAKMSSKNAKKSFTTQYFKEKGVGVQEKVLRFWCNLFMNDFNISESYKIISENKKNKFDKNEKEILIEIQRESYMYCSPKTIKAIKEYQQYLYRHNKDDKKNKGYIKAQIKFSQMFILISRIISKMKYDFTGEKVDELDIIKIKIKDLKVETKIICRFMLWYYNIREIFIKLLMCIVTCFIIYLFLKSYL